MRVITLEDQRWLRCDIKTVQLLYSSMAKNIAKKAGADDAWLVRDGLITEGSSSNAYIVTADGAIVTRGISNLILSGITRAAVLECARELGLRLEERAFDVAEAKAAKEAFITRRPPSSRRWCRSTMPPSVTASPAPWRRGCAKSTWRGVDRPPSDFSIDDTVATALPGRISLGVAGLGRAAERQHEHRIDLGDIAIQGHIAM